MITEQEVQKIRVNNPQLMRRWIEALESGEYPQGSGYLCVNGNYCCLGVLADLAIQDNVIEANWHEVHVDDTTTIKRLDVGGVDEGFDQIIPFALSQQVGLTSGGGEMRLGDGRAARFKAPHVPWDKASLAEANDNGATFAMIAADLRKYVELDDV